MNPVSPPIGRVTATQKFVTEGQCLCRGAGIGVSHRRIPVDYLSGASRVGVQIGSTCLIQTGRILKLRWILPTRKGRPGRLGGLRLVDEEGPRQRDCVLGLVGVAPKLGGRRPHREGTRRDETHPRGRASVVTGPLCAGGTVAGGALGVVGTGNAEAAGQADTRIQDIGGLAGRGHAAAVAAARPDLGRSGRMGR